MSARELYPISIPTEKGDLRLRFRIPINTENSSIERDQCPKCTKMSHIFCYGCCQPTPNGELWLPKPPITLPMHLHILLHPNEHRSKSTALHAKILCAQGSVSVHTYPSLPDCVRQEAAQTLLVYPSVGARPMKDIANIGAMRHIVFIEGTWRQSRAIARDESIAALPNVVTLQEYATIFWRFQSEGAAFLSTIEAIYYAYREYFDAVRSQGGAEGEAYGGEYDELLLLYIRQYLSIQQYYRENAETRTFTHRHREGASYIKGME